MGDRMQNLTQEQMTRLHDASMDILENTGVVFNESEALEIFSKHGFTVDGRTVFFKEKYIARVLESAPAQFTITARNPKKSLSIGGDDFVFGPGYGPTFMADSSGSHRQATMQDYDNFCMLIQTSKYMDMNGFMMVQPCDVAVETSHLDMLLSNITLCDKPYMGSPVSKRGAQDTIEMAAIVWGGKEKLEDMPVTASLINPMSPLRFSEEMAGALVELARYGQACIVSPLIMAGFSGPVTLPGVMALQNAEILAGLALAQLVRPGAPILYGSASAPIDMKSGGLASGAPELSILASATTQMARFYSLPCRAGTAATDAHLPDAQAALESTLTLHTAARSGSNFILHCGTLGAYISMSYEKFMIDEEICGMIRRALTPMEVTDETIDLETIKAVGSGGEYLTQPKTLQRCRTEFFQPVLCNRKNYGRWLVAGGKRIDEKASELLAGRLGAYEKPDIDPSMEKGLAAYVGERKNAC